MYLFFCSKSGQCVRDLKKVKYLICCIGECGLFYYLWNLFFVNCLWANAPARLIGILCVNKRVFCFIWRWPFGSFVREEVLRSILKGNLFQNPVTKFCKGLLIHICSSIVNSDKACSVFTIQGL